MAATGRSPAEVAKHSTFELQFWEYAIQKKQVTDESRYWEKFGRQMGTTWYREDFEEGKGGKGIKLRNTDQMFYPHALLVSPNNLFKQIKKDFEATKPRIAGGEYQPQKGEEIVETSELSYDEFREFFDQFQNGLVGGGT